MIMVLLFALICIGIVAFLRVKKKKNLKDLLLITIFYVYLYKVLDYTLIQFQSLLILKYVVPNLMLRGQEAGESLNLIPLISLTSEDVKTSFLNVLLFVPFGVGLPIITDLRLKQTVCIGAITSMGIEVLQFVTGLIAHMTFRVADINDVIFNTIGVVLGYLFYIGLVRFFAVCR